MMKVYINTDWGREEAKERYQTIKKRLLTVGDFIEISGELGKMMIAKTEISYVEEIGKEISPKKVLKSKK